MEEKELKVENIPGSYALCFNGECGKKDTCMHYQAMLLKRGERGCGMAIYPTAWQDGECCYYREKKLVRKAWGFSQLYKNVDKYHKAEARQSVSSFFGEQQEGIMNIIAQFGPIDDIKFDHYKTDWDFDY